MYDTTFKDKVTIERGQEISVKALPLYKIKGFT
jgi:hypothetical protein